MTHFFFWFAGLYALDLGTKIWVRHAMPLGAEIQIFPFFSLTHVENTGIAFGLFPGLNHVFILIGIALALFLFWLAVRAPRDERALKIILGVISAGAWGNLTDRLMFGRVTDFLDFYAGSYHWPAFNVADASICVGAALLIWQNFTFRPTSCQRQPSDEARGEGD